MLYKRNEKFISEGVIRSNFIRSTSVTLYVDTFDYVVYVDIHNFSCVDLIN